MRVPWEMDDCLLARLFVILIAACGVFNTRASDLQTNQLMLGDKVVTGVVTNGKIVADEVIGSDSNSITILHTEVTPLPGPPGASKSPSSSNAKSKQGLRLLLSTGSGSGQFGGVKGLHGFLYMARDWRKPVLAETNEVDIFSSADGKRIVVNVLDHGPIYSSTNSGMSWTVISAPGTYTFPLTMGSDGSGFLASATIEPPAGGPVNTNLPNRNWYAVARAPDGRKLVLNQDVTNPAPALSIVHSSEGVVVSWPAGAGNFVLQENSNLTTTNWADVTNAVTQFGDTNQVIVSPTLENDFFRLRPR